MNAEWDKIGDELDRRGLYFPRQEETTMNTPTPRTDAAIRGRLIGFLDRSERIEYVYPDFARTLERELADAKAELAAERELSARQLAACDCAAMMDTSETHEKNKDVVRGNPVWSPAFESVMRRTAECIKLRAELVALREDKARLDFIEQHPEIGLGSSRPNIRIVGFSPCKENDWRWSQFARETYRAALDAARKETK